MYKVGSSLDNYYSCFFLQDYHSTVSTDMLVKKCSQPRVMMIRTERIRIRDLSLLQVINTKMSVYMY